jgi:hypothetical protein
MNTFDFSFSSKNNKTSKNETKQKNSNEQVNFLLTSNQNKNKKNEKQNYQNEKKNNVNEKKNNQNEKGVVNYLTSVIGIANQKNSIPNEINSSKRHYFIGYKISNPEQIQLLTNLQKTCIQQYNLKNYYLNFQNDFITRFVYMGYLTPQVASKYMEHIMQPLCIEITKKFPKLVCNYTVVRPKFDKKSVNWMSLFYEDESHYLKKVILPFLEKMGIKPIFPKRYTNYQPMIDLIHFKENSIPKGSTIDVSIPSVSFEINHLSLLSAKPTKTKSGYQAVHDNLLYEEEQKYIFPFQG